MNQRQPLVNQQQEIPTRQQAGSEVDDLGNSRHSPAQSLFDNDAHRETDQSPRARSPPATARPDAVAEVNNHGN